MWFTSHLGSGVSREEGDGGRHLRNNVLIKTQPVNYKMLQFGHM